MGTKFFQPMLQFWLYILSTKYNSYSYMGGTNHDIGQTHSSCECLTNFTVGGEQWGVVAEDSGPQFCCNGAGTIATWDYSTGGPMAGLACNQYNGTDMSHDANSAHGAFASLWCPIDINSCEQHGGKYGANDWVKTHYFNATKMKQPFTVPGLWEGGNYTADAEKSFERMGLPHGIYWDFCVSSFVKRPAKSSALRKSFMIPIDQPLANCAIDCGSIGK